MEPAKYVFALMIVGLLSAKPTYAQNPAEGQKLYVTYCASCHGDTGKGNGAAANALPVKPADHTNGAEMNRLTDKFLREIISKGGPAVGKSSMMPGWGSNLTDRQVSDLVAYIRSIAQPPYKASAK
ncbi:MAG TPA: cytochrome c [Candidatus Binatia bacterium]|nr:cytochrome c [Candidatus Binatia bacterium]